MTDQSLPELVELTGVIYRAEQNRVRELQHQEARLRSAIARLEDHRKSAMALPAVQLAPLRQIGADIAWQGWVGRNKEELNRRLALCLAQKSRLMKGLRRAYGQHSAAESLLHKDRLMTQKRSDQKSNEQEQANNLLRSAWPES